MIFITGDTHGEIARFTPANFPGEETLTENDYVIVCGDFGFVFYDTPQEKDVLDYLSKKPYTICFIDGNHENFPAIYSYPEQEWNGGKVHLIRKNVIHLMRGQVFEIEDKKFFTMGGAFSIDSGCRALGKSYWEEELPNNDEYHEASANLTKRDFCVDYVITHTAPDYVIRRYLRKNPRYEDAELTGFLGWVMEKLKFSKWFFGHWHTDENFDDKFHAIYFDVIKI